MLTNSLIHYRVYLNVHVFKQCNFIYTASTLLQLLRFDHYPDGFHHSKSVENLLPAVRLLILFLFPQHPGESERLHLQQYTGTAPFPIMALTVGSC